MMLSLLYIFYEIVTLPLSCTFAEDTRTMMTSWHGNAFLITGPLWAESTGDRWIPFTKAQQWEPLVFSNFHYKIVYVIRILETANAKNKHVGYIWFKGTRWRLFIQRIIEKYLNYYIETISKLFVCVICVFTYSRVNYIMIYVAQVVFWLSWKYISISSRCSGMRFGYK